MDFTRLGPGVRPKVREALTEVRNYLYPPMGDVFYVSKRGASGDGRSWTKSFLTITEGIAALTNNDTLIIGAGNFDEDLKITLDEVENVRIFGNNAGMQWGEGFTNWRSVISGDDLFDIQNCRGVEIGGIGFIVPTDNKDAIQFVTELSYSIHIHDCSFIGDCGGGAAMAEGIGSPAATLLCDLFVHDCRFFRVKTAMKFPGQRYVIEKNLYVVPASGYGIREIDQPNSFGLIDSNMFLGSASGDYGIFTTTATAGNFMVSRNRFCNFEDTKAINQTAEVSVNFVDNLEDHAEGADRKVDPTSG